MEINRYIYPLYVTFCLTSMCNAKCQHCSSGKYDNYKDDLTLQEIYKVLDDLYNCGVMAVSFSGGEPLLHPQFEDITHYAKSKGFSLAVGTNGKIITEKMAKQIKKWGFDHVQISLDGCNAKTHDGFRGVSGMFDSAINAIKLLLEENIVTNVCMTPNKYNYKEFEETIVLCHELGVNGFNLSQFVPIGRGTEQLDLEPNEWKRILEIWYYYKNKYKDTMNFFAHEAQEILVDSTLYEVKGFVGCQAGSANACIQSDGTVLPCVMVDYSLGNVKQTPFSEIWSNNPIVEKLKSRNFIKEPCGKCKNKNKCGGCRGVALGKTGDLFAADTRCWFGKK